MAELCIPRDFRGNAWCVFLEFVHLAALGLERRTWWWQDARHDQYRKTVRKEDRNGR